MKGATGCVTPPVPAHSGCASSTCGRRRSGSARSTKARPWPRMRSVEIECRRFIAAEPSQAFALSLDPEAFPAWFRGKGLVPAVVRVTRLEDGPLRAGSRRRVGSSDGNSVEETVLELDPPRRHRYRIAGFAPPFGWLVACAEADWHWTPRAEGVVVCWRYRYHPRGWLVRPIIGFIARRDFAAAMQACLDALAASAVEPRRTAPQSSRM